MHAIAKCSHFPVSYLESALAASVHVSHETRPVIKFQLLGNKFRLRTIFSTKPLSNAWETLSTTSSSLTGLYSVHESHILTTKKVLYLWKSGDFPRCFGNRFVVNISLDWFPRNRGMRYLHPPSKAFFCITANCSVFITCNAKAISRLHRVE